MLRLSRSFWQALQWRLLASCVLLTFHAPVCRCLHEIQAVASLPAHRNVIGQVIGSDTWEHQPVRKLFCLHACEGTVQLAPLEGYAEPLHVVRSCCV